MSQALSKGGRSPKLQPTLTKVRCYAAILVHAPSSNLCIKPPSLLPPPKSSKKKELEAVVQGTGFRV